VSVLDLIINVLYFFVEIGFWLVGDSNSGVEHMSSGIESGQ
jgi:hypothetical protein